MIQNIQNIIEVLDLHTNRGIIFLTKKWLYLDKHGSTKSP